MKDLSSFAPNNLFVNLMLWYRFLKTNRSSVDNSMVVNPRLWYYQFLKNNRWSCKVKN